MGKFMNKQQIKYMLEDTKIGLKRNLGSTATSISLLFITLTLFSVVLLSRLFISDTVDYIESQLAMKVYVEDGLVEHVAEVLEKQPYAQQVTIEKGDELIKQLSFFFVGKEHLLEAFTNGSVPDAVKFYVTDVSYMQSIADNLSQTDGIVRVVYPQEMAEKLSNFMNQVELYGYTASIIFALIAFCIVQMTTRLAMFKREKELKVKLLLGMNPKYVQNQFLVEGATIGFIGITLSFVLTFIVYFKGFGVIHASFPYVGNLTAMDLIIVMSIQLIVGLIIAIGASYFSTNKWVRNV